MIARDPEKNIPTLIGIARQFAGSRTYRVALDRLEARIAKDPAVNQKAREILKNPRIVEKFMVNWVLNSLFLSATTRQERIEKGKRCPTVLLIDPTSACNLNCAGCWAGEYSQSDRIEVDRMDRLFDEMKALGIYWAIFSGGEPLLYPHLVDLMQNHDDMAFMAFTNGTLIDDEYADALAKAGNFSPVFSLEGMRETTDARRGEGIFDQVTAAMRRCRERGIPFGASITATRENFEEITSDRFIDFLDASGCMYVWVFHYIPIGRDPDFGLMLTSEQRSALAVRINALRNTKPMLLLDFWNDGRFVNGCIAGGRLYAHINATGDVEPCAFVHYATHNINDVSLEEALENPLFEEFTSNQPFSDNHLAPCPFIDQPEKLRQMVDRAGAYGTHAGAEAALQGDHARALNTIAKRWQDYSQALAEDIQPEGADAWDEERPMSGLPQDSQLKRY